MTSGGVRAGAGPKPDPRSASAERRSAGLVLLPAGGYSGPVPDFPIPHPLERDLELWAWAWTTPQAAAWAAEPWRQYQVAQWCQLARDCEQPAPTGSARTGVNSAADRIGLSEAGLRFNGWAVARDEMTPARVGRAAAPTMPSSRARMTILADDSRPA